MRAAKREKNENKNEDSLRDLWDNIKWTDICIIGLPGGREGKKIAENLFEEIMAENFSNLKKETGIQIQEARKFQIIGTQRNPH